MTTALPAHVKPWLNDCLAPVGGTGGSGGGEKRGLWEQGPLWSHLSPKQKAHGSALSVRPRAA